MRVLWQAGTYHTYIHTYIHTTYYNIHTYIHTYTPIQEPRVQLERRDADAKIEDAVADREKPRKISPALRQDRGEQPCLENLRRRDSYESEVQY